MQRLMTIAAAARNRRRRAVAVAAIAVVLALLRIARALTLGPNSDEAQHLHVVWAWTQGLLVYRDVFDNHMPLFHALCAPLLAWFGERADIVACMRLAMIPLYFGVLWATWCIGRALGGARVAALAALLAGTMPAFFDVSAQFRPDLLWALLWLAAIAVLVREPASARRAFLGGVLVGAAFVTSAKTSLLLATAIAAGAGVLLLAARERAALLRGSALPLACGTIGALLLPAAIALYFLAHGAWREAMYCVFEHNLVPGLGRWQGPEWRFWVPPFGYALALAFAWRCRRLAEPRRWRAATWVLLSAAAYLLALYGWWPLFTRQDLLPVLPLLAVGAALGLVGAAAPRWRIAAGWMLLAATLFALAARTTWNPDRLRHAESDLARLLALARPGEYVMDAKGESIFRPRPIYWVLEGVTEARLRNGSIRDDLRGCLAATSTMLLVDDRIPALDRGFVDANYVAAGHRLRVAGRLLGALAAGQGVAFETAVAGDYRFIDREGGVAGTLDGIRVDGPVLLGAGTHRFVAEAPAEIAYVPAAMLQRGLAPAAVFAPEAQDEASADLAAAPDVPIADGTAVHETTGVRFVPPPCGGAKPARPEGMQAFP